MQIAAGETLQGVLVTHTENDGNYPNHACQSWNIIADENQVYLASNKIIHVVVQCRRIYLYYQTKYIFLSVKCIVIRVGDGGFDTESGFDFVQFDDSNSGMFTIHKLTEKQMI